MVSSDLDNNQFFRTINANSLKNLCYMIPEFLIFVYERNSCIEVLEISFVHKQYKIDSKGHFKFKTEF
jgi:hypothetical protein